MALYNDITLYTTDTFSVWREKYNQLIQQVLSQNIPNSTSTPIEFIQITIPEDNQWTIKIPGVLVEKFKFDIYLVHETITEDNTEKLLQYPNDWYIAESGALILNTPLLPGDIISIRVYGIKDGKKWTDFYQKYYTYRLNDLQYTVNESTSIINLPFIMNFDEVDVFLNGVLLTDVDYSFSQGQITINAALNINDILGFGIVTPARDLEKYRILGANVNPSGYDGLKSILDSQSLIQWEWMVDNYSDILNPNVDVPTLNEAEYIRRSILAKSSNLGSLNIK